MVRAHYLEEIEKLKSRYADGLRAAGIDYQMMTTATPLDCGAAAGI